MHKLTALPQSHTTRIVSETVVECHSAYCVKVSSKSKHQKSVKMYFVNIKHIEMRRYFSQFSLFLLNSSENEVLRILHKALEMQIMTNIHRDQLCM